MHVDEGRRRVVIEAVEPEIDCGRFPIKRTVGEKVVVEADVFADGHDSIRCLLLYRKEADRLWTEIPMEPLVNDRWRAEFSVSEIGSYRYTVQGWVDRFLSWNRDLSKKIQAAQDTEIDFVTGARLLEDAAKRAPETDAERLHSWASSLSSKEEDLEAKRRLVLDEELNQVAAHYPDKVFAATYGKELTVVVDPKRARFSSWYEIFPRSWGEAGQHGSFADVERRLGEILEMGFDVLYFPPIHPIGRSFRKGRNNSPASNPDDVGSPWGIGSDEGGHKSIHRQLGTLEDFRRLVQKARSYGIEIALDIAYQCSPDHPYVKEHPEWFRHRPDGTIQYAENPPKKYQDIYPIDFETSAWRELWEELRSVFLFWREQGVRIFRVDNPHTKALQFWGWVIEQVKSVDPEIIFLAEAFTRPKVMYWLAKVGFTQSYTYFAWRNTKWELTQYFTELTQSEVREFFRPSLWPNTPDILTEYLQLGGRPAFMARLILAATLGANYGIYGAAFELCQNQPRERGSEEYLNSEKYEIKNWDVGRHDSLRGLVSLVNRIRRDNPALHSDWNLHFHRIDNDQLICYSKVTEDKSNVILAVVNLDPHYTQSGWVDLDLNELGVEGDRPYQVHDLLTGARYLWQGSHNYVLLNPQILPAHVFLVRRRIRTEQDFDYYM
jgi:starch synthase (maltosyl-transferring)